MVQGLLIEPQTDVYHTSWCVPFKEISKTSNLPCIAFLKTDLTCAVHISSRLKPFNYLLVTVLSSRKHINARSKSIQTLPLWIQSNRFLSCNSRVLMELLNFHGRLETDVTMYHLQFFSESVWNSRSSAYRLSVLCLCVSVWDVLQKNATKPVIRNAVP